MSRTRFLPTESRFTTKAVVAAGTAVAEDLALVRVIRMAAAIRAQRGHLPQPTRFFCSYFSESLQLFLSAISYPAFATPIPQAARDSAPAKTSIMFTAITPS